MRNVALSVSILSVGLCLGGCSAEPDSSPGGSGGTSSGTGGFGNAASGGTGAGATGGATTGGSGGLPGGSGGTAGTGGGSGGFGNNSGSGGFGNNSGSGGFGNDSGSGGSAGGDPGSGGSASSGGAAGADGTGGSAGSAGSSGSGGAPGVTGKFVGNITTNGQVRSDFIQYWDQITPENEGKWGSVEPQRDQMNWAGMDRVRDYAREHNIPYKGHTLVWGSQQPGWIAGLPQQEQREEVEEWIRLFCERYPDVAMIDVVNEPPPHTTPPYAEALGGSGASGWDWIVQAFEWTRQYCPNAILILNDYNTIEWPNDTNNIIDIAKRVKNAGAPIDAIGAQAHGAFDFPTSEVEQKLNRIANETGLPIYITEYDINLANDEQQRQVMESQFKMFWENPNVKGITLWGYVSGSTWLANSGLMSSGGQQRPAMQWLMDFLDR